MKYSFIGYLPNIIQDYNVSTNALLRCTKHNRYNGCFHFKYETAFYVLSGKGKAVLERRCKERLIHKAKKLNPDINGIINVHYSFSYNNYNYAGCDIQLGVQLFATGAAVVLK